MKTPPERSDNMLTVIALILGAGVCLAIVLLFLTSVGDGPGANISAGTPSPPGTAGTVAPGAPPLGPRVE